MGLKGPSHLASQAEGHQLRNGQHLHGGAKRIPAYMSPICPFRFLTSMAWHDMAIQCNAHNEQGMHV